MATSKNRKKKEEPRTAATPAAAPRPLGLRLRLAAPLLLGSGCCALVYQIAWQREFRLIFGASTAASAAVIAVFMGGLGLGAWLLGPRADRRTQPLRFYAALEAAVALTAALTPLQLLLARRVYFSLGGSVVLGALGGTLVRLLLAGLVLLLPTFFAGGTLGAAARAIENETDRSRRGTALLYGFNTLGAVAGCLLATFWLLEAAGTRGTLWLAAGANLALAALAYGVSLRLAPSPVAANAEPVLDRAPKAPWRLVCAAAALVGFVFFLMELVWYRMLGPILGGTVYTFGLVLAVALAGIAVGGLAYSLIFLRRAPSLAAFAVSCLAEAAALALPFAAGDRIALLALALRPATGAPLWDYLAGWTIVTAVVVLPASIVAGAQFPLLVALLGEGRARVAQHLGAAYFWNTLGGIAGALAGGFGLLPVLTAPGCWKAGAMALTALALVAAARHGARLVPAIAAGSLVVASLLFLSDGPTAVWRHSSIGVGRANAPLAQGANAVRAWMNDARRSITWEREGIESSVAVQTIGAYSLVVNGKVDGNARNDAPTQVMGGLLGALVSPGARRSLVIGLGTGSTAGWLAAVPGMERTDVVELEPAVAEMAHLCGPVNRDALSNPRVRLLLGDARELLTTGRERYGLIFSEPSNPYRAGVASLFTREFYEAVAARLEPDGVFLQWVQAYEVDPGTIATVVATLNTVLPEIEIWQVHQIDLLLVASRRPLRHDAADLRARLRAEPFATAARAAWRAQGLEDVLARFVAAPALARHMRARGAELNTDDRNTVEFAFARTLSRSGLFEIPELRRAAVEVGADRPVIEGNVDWGRVERERRTIYTIAGAAAPAAADLSEAERNRAEAHAAYLTGNLTGAVAALERNATQPEGAIETTIFAEGLAEAGDVRATEHIRNLRAIDVAEADAATARLALRIGQPELARDALVASLLRYRSDPWPNQVSMSRALALADELTLARPDMVPIVFETLGQPFAVAALEAPRQLMRLSVASHNPTRQRCRDAVAPFEPHVAWQRAVLRFRSECYRLTGDPRASAARADLERYERQGEARATPEPRPSSTP